MHYEWTLGLEVYLQVCANYIDILLSVSIDLEPRILLACKVLFSLSIVEAVWLKYGDHTVGGNPEYTTPVLYGLDSNYL